MKKTLQEITGIKLLRRNEKLNANCCYILSSESVAINTYFNSKKDVERAHEMFIKHLTSIMDIIDYLITPNGWTLMVTIKSEVEILDNIDLTIYDSNKMKAAVKEKNIAIILSECIRYAISGMTRKNNDRNSRKGTMVCRNFSRFIFKDIDSAQQMMRKMKEEQVDLCWQKKRYKPCLKMYNADGKLKEKGDVFLCSKNYARVIKIKGLINFLVPILSKKIAVLREKIEATRNTHFPSKNPFKNHQTHSLFQT